jgi:hypothetical protein
MTELRDAYSYSEGFADMEEAPHPQEKSQKRQLHSQQRNDMDEYHYQHQQEAAMTMPKPRVQLPSPPSPPPVIKEVAGFTNYQNNQQQSMRFPEYSFWDRMVMSRREVLKLFILSIVIVLGISLEKIACHYMTNYLTSNDLTTFQELLIRLSFPIVVFLILWIIKSL